MRTYTMTELGPDEGPCTMLGELVELQLPWNQSWQPISLPGISKPVHPGVRKQRFAHSAVVDVLVYAMKSRS